MPVAVGVSAGKPGPERLPAGRRRPVVARDQVERIPPDIPRPGEVTPLPHVHPIHQRRDEGAAALHKSIGLLDTPEQRGSVLWTRATVL